MKPQKILALFALSILFSQCSTPLEEAVSDHYQNHMKPFYHGVASGDPLPTALIIWTRITPDRQMKHIEVTWEISLEANFATVIKSGLFTTGPKRDYTVKVDVQGLSPGTKYYYRFQGLGGTSPVGIARTIANNARQVKLAVVSCSNYEFGYFNAYGALAQVQDLDAVVHLGDYIYEYGQGVYGDTTIGRHNLPNKELITLSDYRTRYSLYHTDPDLQAAHAAAAFINIWDDHEIANDAYVEGAQNHQDDEGPYDDRKSAAVRAFYEWLPIREGQHYRSFSFGDRAQLIMLDERLAGRTAPVDSVTDPNFQDPNRAILGQEQLAWVQKQLSESQAQWKIIGNQVIFSYLNYGYEGQFTTNLDSWDGYPSEQRALASFIKSEEIKNLVFVTGDTHRSWAFEVAIDPFHEYDASTGKGAMAVEFGTTSISSSNANEMATDSEVIAHEEYISNSPLNPHLKYVNMRDHGYLLLHLTEEEAIGEFWYVETLTERNISVNLGKRIWVANGQTRLQQ